MVLQFDAESTLDELRDLESAVIDTSSVIYATKAGVLDALCSTLQLVTVNGVERELGAALPLIRIASGAGNLPVDDQVLALARIQGTALICEDRKVIEKAAGEGLGVYNMLIMLEFLLWRGSLDLSGWDTARKRLLAAAHYTARVIDAGRKLHWAVRKEVG